MAPQLIPAGLEVMVPEPVPAFVVERRNVETGGLNVAVQLRAALMVTEPSLQSASPDQPAKVEPPLGVAVMATTVPEV